MTGGQQGALHTLWLGRAQGRCHSEACGERTASLFFTTPLHISRTIMGSVSFREFPSGRLGSFTRSATTKLLPATRAPFIVLTAIRDAASDARRGACKLDVKMSCKVDVQQ